MTRFLFMYPAAERKAAFRFILPSMLRSSEAHHSCDNLFYHVLEKQSRNAEALPSFPRPPLHADELTIPLHK
jgi:hypothetical protein